MSRPAAYRRLWSHELKEIVIRIVVFNRSADYNPKSDPVVRVEAHPSSKARTVLRRRQSGRLQAEIAKDIAHETRATLKPFTDGFATSSSNGRAQCGLTARRLRR
jgi:hypothetical protein